MNLFSGFLAWQYSLSTTSAVTCKDISYWTSSKIFSSLSSLSTSTEHFQFPGTIIHHEKKSQAHWSKNLFLPRGARHFHFHLCQFSDTINYQLLENWPASSSRRQAQQDPARERSLCGGNAKHFPRGRSASLIWFNLIRFDLKSKQLTIVEVWKFVCVDIILKVENNWQSW